MWYKTEILLI